MIKQNYPISENPCYKADRKIKVKGLYLHSVGCPCEVASRFLDNENKADASAAVHAVIDAEGRAWIALPLYPETGEACRNWHGGSGYRGSCNDTHIGIEMTEPATIRYISGANWVELGDGTHTRAHVMATYKAAVEYFAELCRDFGLDPLEDGVILSHSEGHARGFASNHADVEHLWSAYGLTMDQFREAVKNTMNGAGAAEVPDIQETDSSGQEVKPLEGALIVTYSGEDGLNVRETPSFTAHVKRVAQVDDIMVVTGISEDERWYRMDDGGSDGYVTTVKDYVRFYATEAQKEETGDGKYYRVRTSWDEAATQIGAFKDLENAMNTAEQNPGYHVYGPDGEEIRKEQAEAFQVRVRKENANLRIRKGPGTNFDFWEEPYGDPRYTGEGIFTIDETAKGPGAARWGLLRAYSGEQNGWIALDFTERL